MVASAEVFQVQPSAFHSLTAWDTEEILFIGARPLHVRQAISFIDIYIYILLFFLTMQSRGEQRAALLFPKQRQCWRRACSALTGAIYSRTSVQPGPCFASPSPEGSTCSRGSVPFCQAAKYFWDPDTRDHAFTWGTNAFLAQQHSGTSAFKGLLPP